MRNQEEYTGYQTMNSTRNPIAPEARLWRYLEFEKFAWLIEKSTLHHSRLDRLGDPFEGSVTAPYALQRDSGNLIGYMPIPQYEAANNRRLTLVNYATCWHANQKEVPTMWETYTRNQNGVAIVTTFSSLATSVDTSKFKRPILGPVEYFDFDNDDMSLPRGLQGRPGFSKRDTYAHEREIRGMVSIDDFPEEPSDMFAKPYIDELKLKTPVGIQLPVNLQRMVDEIVVAPSTPDWIFELVRSLADHRGLGPRVRHSELLKEPIF